MTEKNTGGPAFPCDPASQSFSGVTMRDYFAAKAMQAFCANDWPVHSDDSAARLASFAYMMADRMLEARK